jgi:Domain of Unknown Function with PDB structure (DUF3857)
MKTIYLSLFILLAASSQIAAQKGLPEIGEIDKTDLLLTDCEFDKGAEAFKLIDYGSVEFLGSSRGLIYYAAKYTRRVRIKILKEKGISYANVVISFLAIDDYEKIEDLVAYTYNLDEAGNVKATKVSKASISKKKINSSFSEMIIAFPEVKVGSVVEYSYTMERGLSFNINDWDFQDRIPVRFSEYSVAMPTYLHFKAQPFVTDNMETREKESKTLSTINPSNGVREYTMVKYYTMRNIKGLGKEPYMGAEKDYRQRVEFLLTQVEAYNNEIVDLSTSWSLMVDYSQKSKYFGLQMEAFIGKTLKLVDEWKAIPDMKTRIKTIFKHVQQTITSDNSKGILSYDGVEAAYNNKTGSIADINLLLLNLLIKADVKAIPILFSSRDNGLVNTAYPDVNQFNTVMAYVAVDDKYWILDASDKLSSCTIIPEQVVNSNGFLLMKPGGKWLEVLENKVKYKVFTAVKAEINAEGKMTGDATVNCSGYAKRDRGSSWTKNKEEFKTKFFSIPDMSVNLDSIVVNNINDESLPLEQKVKFNCMLNRSGEYTFFTVNIFSGIEKNPFIAEQRISDIDFGYLQDYTIVGSFIIPEGYAIDAMPENISLTMPDKSIVFSRFMTANENQLNVRMSLDFKNSFYSVEIYEEFREFYKKLFSTLNEQVVIKKK